MNNSTSLSFIEHSIDGYVTAALRLYEEGCKSFLFMPVSPMALTVAKGIRAQLGRSVKLCSRETAMAVNSGIFDARDAHENSDATLLIENNEDALSELLMQYLNNPSRIIAPITAHYFKNRGLFITTIPKSGTHMIMPLLSHFGFQPGGDYTGTVKPGYWHYLTDKVGPHCEFREFYTYLRFQPNGGILHPLFWSPVIFLYRHPLDLAVSACHYITKPEANPWAHYYRTLSKSELLKDVLCGGVINTSIRIQVMLFTYWLKLPNVIPISYEEIVGSKGGGSDEEQIKTIWSLQLKLHVQGNPYELAKKVYDTGTRTFRKGKIYDYLSYFEEEGLMYAETQPNDYLDIYGYSIVPKPGRLMPKYVDKFRSKALSFPPCVPDWLFSPVTVETYGCYNIIRCGNGYYGVPHSLGEVDIIKAMQEQPEKLKKGPTVEDVRTAINKEAECQSAMYPQLIESISTYNIVKIGKMYYGVPQSLGEIDFSKDLQAYAKQIFTNESLVEVKRRIMKRHVEHVS